MKFKEINKIIEFIEKNEIGEYLNFNQMAKDFYLKTQGVQLSKYLRINKKTKKLPKIMNVRKAGELLIETKYNKDVLVFVLDNFFEEIPILNFTNIMLLRKCSAVENWKK